ncbi:MAG: response regulator [Desulfatiglandales bacterium]
MSNRILVIDDEDAVRKSFVLALEDLEYQVDTTESGERGIEMEKEGKYDLIFLDQKMPGLNGAETLQELRKIDNEVPIYIITAFYEEFFKDLKGTEKDGIEFDLLQKPFSIYQIALTVKSVLNGPLALKTE